MSDGREERKEQEERRRWDEENRPGSPLHRELVREGNHRWEQNGHPERRDS